jgi:hypothetical protein
MSPNISGAEQQLVVSPRVACVMLNIGTTKLYSLLATRELETYMEGRVRRITVASIHRRIARLLAASTHGTPPQPRRRGRPRKTEASAPPNAA